ncbi:MAG: hypothetical protein AVDCRST_MAG77-1271 [uncultured Chloroflexi bacterium]|uniref:Uncharacterized protein n=1 Tax=uncultured Chloroflexota bacterium TaxID=166587 RepID=A0A6J4HZZ6_9CHLR|nr:MAG: hypothetical protein AVDCRST_MAG77-1271 [uncultured Chloroflexota bacterium]
MKNTGSSCSAPGVPSPLSGEGQREAQGEVAGRWSGTLTMTA